MKRLSERKADKSKGNFKLKAILTVELAYLFIVLFSIFVLIIHTVFYYHDKNILQGAASETAVLWAQLERRQGEYVEESAETFYQKRISGKLILFSGSSVSVEQTDEEVIVIASAEKGFMKVRVHGLATIVKPENKIRKKRIVEDWIGPED